MGAGVRKNSGRGVQIWGSGLQRSTGAYTTLSYLLPHGHFGSGDWSVREMEEEIAEEFAVDGILMMS